MREAASLPASQALAKNVVDIVAPNLAAVLDAADGRTVDLGGRSVPLHTAGLRIAELPPDFRVRVLSVLTDPNIAYLLMLVGLYGLIFEVVAPGTLFPGVTGAIALVVGLYALNLLPLDFAGVGLVLLGIAMLVAEAFVPSFGSLGIGGAVAFGLGSLFMFEDVPGFSLSPAVIAVATLASAGLLILVLAAAFRAHRGRVVTGDAALVGASGRVLDWSGTAGSVLFHGERWRARADAPLSPGEPVTIRGRENLTLLVEPVREAAAPAPSHKP